MNYSVIFRMEPKPWHSAVKVFDDGQCHVQTSTLNPDNPLVVEVEGQTPSELQVQRCAEIWFVLSAHFDFHIASFCPALLPHCHNIMAPIIENIPA